MNVQFEGNVTGVSFTSTSDKRLKDNVEDVTTAEAGAILDTVSVKKYTRTDRNEKRVGFIAQDLAKVCTDHFAHIVGSISVAQEDAEGEDIPGSEQELLTVDYSRLVTVLWTTVQDLRSRVRQLEQRNV